MNAAAVLALLVAGAPAVEAQPMDAARVERLVDEVVAAPEFHHLLRYREDEAEPETPSRSSSSPGRAARESTRPARAGTQADLQPGFAFPDLRGAAAVLRLVVYAALAAVAVWILALVLRLLMRPRDAVLAAAGEAVPDLGEAPAAETAPDESLRRALEHARAGRYAEAIRLLLLGALGLVERRGLIHYRKGLTNRDYLRAARREPRLRDGLEGVVRAFDEVHFGRREATAERFERCLASYRAGIAQ